MEDGRRRRRQMTVVDDGCGRGRRRGGGVFFWLAGVRGDGQRRAANVGGGDVQQTTPGTLGSVGERRDGRRVTAAAAAAYRIDRGLRHTGI